MNIFANGLNAQTRNGTFRATLLTGRGDAETGTNVALGFSLLISAVFNFYRFYYFRFSCRFYLVVNAVHYDVMILRVCHVRNGKLLRIIVTRAYEFSVRPRDGQTGYYF